MQRREFLGALGLSSFLPLLGVNRIARPLQTTADDVKGAVQTVLAATTSIQGELGLERRIEGVLMDDSNIVRLAAAVIAAGER